MAEREGFEPPDARTSAVFKTAAINQTLPSLHMAESAGFEPAHLLRDGQLSKLLVSTSHPTFHDLGRYVFIL